MEARSKVFAIESMVVMLVLVLFAFVTFLVIDAGTNAYDKIIHEKQSTASARVAYSYVNMKVKQNDVDDNVNVLETEFGNTLKIDIADTAFSTYIFFSDGALYECVTKNDRLPSIAAANKITTIDGFEVFLEDQYLRIVCICQTEEDTQIINGTVGLRS